MRDGKCIESYMAEYLGNSGIISLDVGTVMDNTETWQVVESYCDSTVASLHKLVSHKFVENMGENEPINYLYEDWKNRVSNDEIVFYSFSNKGFIKTTSDIDNILEIEKESSQFEQYKLKSQNQEISYDFEIDEDVDKKLDDIIHNANIKEKVSSFDKFLAYQNVFTQLVLTAFNSELNKKNKGLIKYVTIVLFRNYYDGKWHLSYNAAIFSNNLSYLNNPAINLLFDYISRGNYLKEIELLKKNVKRESEKSAKAAIMSRNMSHNIGSHVMSYLKQHLSSVKDMVNDRILFELIKKESDLSSKLDKSTDNLELPFLVGLGHFVSYLQERQDFIATIATDFIPYYSTVNLKDGIYDTLNPDKKFERHSNKETVLQTDNILLGNIARSEGLGRPTSPTRINDNSQSTTLSDIVIKFRDFNGNATEGDNVKEEDKPFIEKMEQSLKELRECDISLPGGIVGRQAIFSILENIIRNAAKHGSWRSKGKLELTIDVFSSRENDIKRLPMHDNDDDCLSLKQVIEKFYLNAEDKDDLFYITITDNCDFSLDSLGKLRGALIDDYVDANDGLMKSGNKGLKEMRISAAWLRRIKDEEICLCPYSYFDKESKDYSLIEKDVTWESPKRTKFNAPILYARIAAKREFDKDTNKYGDVYERNLQYIFCLSIPKKVAIVSSSFDFSDDVKKSLISINWRAFSKEEFVKENNKSFDFILCDDHANGTLFSNIRPIASSRILPLKDIDGLNREDFLNNLGTDKLKSDEIELLLYKTIATYNTEDYINIDDKTIFGKYLAQPSNFVRIEKEGDEMHVYNSKDKDENNTDRFIEDKELVYTFSKYKKLLPDGIFYIDGNVIISDGDDCGKYIYRRHHETKGEFGIFMNKHDNSFNGFVEGISGNNSTDRIVRNGRLDDFWFYQQMHIMKQQIAIFDERLFTKIIGKEESDFVRGNASILNEENLETVKRNYCDLIDANSEKSIEEKNKAKKDINRAKKVQTLKNTINRYGWIVYKKEVESKELLATIYAQKGVFIFNLIEDVEDKRKYNLVGIKMENENAMINKESGNYECYCCHLAELSFSEKKELNIKLLEAGVYMKQRFDFITIHQGLLDKLYQAAGIKASPDEREKKIQFTNELYNKFSRHSKNNVVFENFIPGFIVHSGRSKPGKNEMPQKLPFIQYASLEHSVMDCKFTLVELLDFARYE